MALYCNAAATSYQTLLESTLCRGKSLSLFLIRDYCGYIIRLIRNPVSEIQCWQAHWYGGAGAYCDFPFGVFRLSKKMSSHVRLRAAEIYDSFLPFF